VYGYSLDLPDLWTAIPATEPVAKGQPPLTGRPVTDVIAARPNRRVSKMDLPALVIGAQDVDDDVTLDEWTDTVAGIVDRQKQCGTPQHKERVQIKRTAAVVLDYPDCPKGSHLNHLWVTAVVRGRGYHIVFFDDVGHEAADRKLLDGILATFSFPR
jgi:hypothetical protein